MTPPHKALLWPNRTYFHLLYLCPFYKCHHPHEALSDHHEQEWISSLTWISKIQTPHYPKPPWAVMAVDRSPPCLKRSLQGSEGAELPLSNCLPLLYGHRVLDKGFFLSTCWLIKSSEINLCPIQTGIQDLTAHVSYSNFNFSPGSNPKSLPLFSLWLICFPD